MKKSLALLTLIVALVSVNGLPTHAGTSSSAGGDWGPPSQKLDASDSADLSRILGLYGPGQAKARIICRLPGTLPSHKPGTIAKCGGVVAQKNGPTEKGQFNAEDSAAIAGMVKLPYAVTAKGQRVLRFEAACQVKDASTRNSTAWTATCTVSK